MQQQTKSQREATSLQQKLGVCSEKLFLGWLLTKSCSYKNQQLLFLTRLSGWLSGRCFKQAYWWWFMTLLSLNTFKGKQKTDKTIRKPHTFPSLFLIFLYSKCPYKPTFCTREADIAFSANSPPKFLLFLSDLPSLVYILKFSLKPFKFRCRLIAVCFHLWVTQILGLLISLEF